MLHSSVHFTFRVCRIAYGNNSILADLALGANSALLIQPLVRGGCCKYSLTDGAEIGIAIRMLKASVEDGGFGKPRGFSTRFDGLMTSLNT